MKMLGRAVRTSPLRGGISGDDVSTPAPKARGISFDQKTEAELAITLMENSSGKKTASFC